ncbi:DNA cytosine methyltransferase [Listeria booriae]|uniref:DNA cytosine methyltransferase n=1 Tax=Listeria booriae TaxID=1552123 RepID=UPI0016252F30|nr:DNA cytosine methyltransferase [Listeria booriae]MBC1233554.1 DNA cytosine methyltransferase [Listeria booriae]MBC1245874.1 DNA cytosine methyltransferase [Listeria booriae]MBC1273375.1 DNA cytosine methyltransferase [Listeria booriae]
MPTAIDLFCGAGGFSEGLIQAGFDIVFSSDRSKEVKETYEHRHRQLGLIQGINTHFELADIRELTATDVLDAVNSLSAYSGDFKKGMFDAIFGGPPCQGFSRAGKRDSKDPRNMLFHEYLRIIRDLYPKYVVMENVAGFMDMQMLDFPSVLKDREYRGQVLVSEILQEELVGLGYHVLQPKILDASDYGVPQKRRRAVFIAYRADVEKPCYPTPTSDHVKVTVKDALSGLYSEAEPISEYGMESMNGRTPDINGKTVPVEKIIQNQDVSTHTASVIQRFELYRQGESTKNVVTRINSEGLKDLVIKKELLTETLFHVNKVSNEKVIMDILDDLGLKKDEYSKPRWLGNTNKLLSSIELANSDVDKNKLLKNLANRIDATVEQTEFFYQLSKERLNQKIRSDQLFQMLEHGDISDTILEGLFTKKNSRRRIDSNKPSPTMVTLPDDFIHPDKNRILSVREMARFQSFDDSFEFLGKRTTGGEKRKEEVPQYTQVGNAVPPLLARAIAKEIYRALKA